MVFSTGSLPVGFFESFSVCNSKMRRVVQKPLHIEVGPLAFVEDQ